jgi:hypothetical protein
MNMRMNIKNTVAVVALALFSLTANAQSMPWSAVVLSVYPGGWFEIRGTATSDDGLREIVVKDAEGETREIYKGRLKGSRWTGSRTVMATEIIDEPISGKFSRYNVNKEEVQMLILTNEAGSANFTRTITRRK